MNVFVSGHGDGFTLKQGEEADALAGPRSQKICRLSLLGLKLAPEASVSVPGRDRTLGMSVRATVPAYDEARMKLHTPP